MNEWKLRDEPVEGACIDFRPDEIIRFTITDETIISLDRCGMIYKGERIEDAGEAYRLFVGFLNLTVTTENKGDI